MKNSISCGRLLLRLLYPPKCISCGEILESDSIGVDSMLCKKCQEAFETAREELCRKCYMPPDNCHCLPATLKRRYIKGLIRLAVYHPKNPGSVINMLINNMKRRYDKNALEVISSLLAESIVTFLDEDNNENDETESDEAERDKTEKGKIEKGKIENDKTERNLTVRDKTVITYCPRSRKAIRKYGHDQSRLLAEEISRITGIKFEKLIVRKSRFNDIAQKDLSGRQRLRYAKGLYRVCKGKEPVGMNVILVDDVVTTGATMINCAKQLQAAGAASIICVCIACSDNSINK